MAFAFWIAVACSCRLLVRLHFGGHVHESQLGLAADKKLIVVDSTVFRGFQQRDKLTPDPIVTTFAGIVSVGAPAASTIPPGGYVVMVLTEDLDPVNGTTLRGTIAMVVIEDVETERVAEFNYETASTDATAMISTTKVSAKKTQAIATAASIRLPASVDCLELAVSSASTDSPALRGRRRHQPRRHQPPRRPAVTKSLVQRVLPAIQQKNVLPVAESTRFSERITSGPSLTSRICISSTRRQLTMDEHEHLKNVHAPESRVEAEQPQRHMTVLEKIRHYEMITARNSRVSTNTCRGSSEDLQVTCANALRNPRLLTTREPAADNKTLVATTITSFGGGMDASAAAAFVQQLRRRIILRKCTPQRHTDVALESALDTLRRIDLEAMETACATIQKLTRDSRECCSRCVEVPASLLIYNALVRMSCQSCDPTVVHNLLLSLGNLARYRQWKQQQPATRFERSGVRAQLDSCLVELLGEMLLILSDELRPREPQSWALFTAATEALWDIVVLWRSGAGASLRPVDDAWSSTHQRLLDLQRRLTSVLARSSPKERFVQYLTHAAAALAKTASLM